VSSGGTLRAWVRVNVLVLLTGIAPALLVVPLLTLLASEFTSFTGYLLLASRNLLDAVVTLIEAVAAMAGLVLAVADGAGGWCWRVGQVGAGGDGEAAGVNCASCRRCCRCRRQGPGGEWRQDRRQRRMFRKSTRHSRTGHYRDPSILHNGPARALCLSAEWVQLDMVLRMFQWERKLPQAIFSAFSARKSCGLASYRRS
jgi:hypothetical protein